MAGGHLAEAATGLYPDLPVIMYGSAADRGGHIQTVAADDLGSPELAAAVGEALENSETMAARPASRPETILATMFERNSEHLYVTARRHDGAQRSSNVPPERLTGETKTFSFALAMQESAGNEFQADGLDILDSMTSRRPAGHPERRRSPVRRTDELAGLIGVTQDVADQKERERLLRQPTTPPEGGVAGRTRTPKRTAGIDRPSLPNRGR